MLGSVIPDEHTPIASMRVLDCLVPSIICTLTSPASPSVSSLAVPASASWRHPPSHPISIHPSLHPGSPPSHLISIHLVSAPRPHPVFASKHSLTVCNLAPTPTHPISTDVVSAPRLHLHLLEQAFGRFRVCALASSPSHPISIQQSPHLDSPPISYIQHSPCACTQASPPSHSVSIHPAPAPSLHIAYA